MPSQPNKKESTANLSTAVKIIKQDLVNIFRWFLDKPESSIESFNEIEKQIDNNQKHVLSYLSKNLLTPIRVSINFEPTTKIVPFCISASSYHELNEQTGINDDNVVVWFFEEEKGVKIVKSCVLHFIRLMEKETTARGTFNTKRNINIHDTE